jgi:RNA polymerase sigma-70 factor (ECF subfamily)
VQASCAHEDALRAMVQRGEARRAAQEALQSYGPELFGFLIAVVEDRDLAAAVYAGACRRMDQELAEFTWTCSLRTWMYALMRRQLGRQGHATTRRPGASPSSIALPDPAHTISRRPAGRRAAVAALRMRLPQEDRELLILRVDRSLAWKEIAITALGWNASPIDLARESDRLRARMRVVREELARAAEAHHGEVMR